MMNSNTVESILKKVAAGFTVFSIDVFTRDGNIASKDWTFDNVEEAIAVYGAEEVYRWKLESEYNGEVRVTIRL